MTPTRARAMHDLVDLSLLFAAFVGAYLLRFDSGIPPGHVEFGVAAAPYVILLQYCMLIGAGVPRFAWRFVGIREAGRILLATGLATAVLLFVRFAVPWLAPSVPIYPVLPLGVIVFDGVLAFLFVVGIRVARRGVLDMWARRSRAVPTRQAPTLLIGAGEVGARVARELLARPELGMRPIGFVDDDPLKQGLDINGLPVLGVTAAIAELADDRLVRRAVISIANVDGSTVRRLKELCETAGVKPQIVPSLHELLIDEIDVIRMRDVSIEDLLRREVVSLDEASARRSYAGKVVLVTGAAGSIGSEICRQIARLGPAKLILAERAEPSLFAVDRELRKAGYGHLLEAVLCDVCDADRMRMVFEKHRPQVVFHAAAHKHVPMVEANISEAVRNNVFGTRVVADAAHDLGVEAFVLISSDKAVNPTSIMGGTKRLAEMYLQARWQDSKTRFMAVRFGNVLDSAGSVLPIFREQIAAGGPVTVTHSAMTRYFLTIPEATQLVLEAGAMGEGGEVFLLDMGEPVRIADLASDLIRLSGFEPGKDIEIEYTGIRPGEKLFEELSFDPENMARTQNEKVFVAKLMSVRYAYMQRSLRLLRDVLYSRDEADIRRLLHSLIPEMQVGPPVGLGELSALFGEHEAEDATTEEPAAEDRRLRLRLVESGVRGASPRSGHAAS